MRNKDSAVDQGESTLVTDATSSMGVGNGEPGSSGKRSRVSWKRALLPGAVLLVSLFVVFPVAGIFSSKLGSITENDQAAFLPDSAESTRSLELETRFAGSQDIPALIVWERPGGLTQPDLAAVTQAAARVSEVAGVAGPVSPPIPSRDGEAVQVVVPLPGDNSAFETLGASSRT